MLPNAFYEINITLIPKPDKYTIEKDNHRLITLMSTDAINPQESISKMN